MKSFNRIRALNNVVCDLIEKENLNNIVVADIATDHGYLAEQLCKNEKIAKVFATDISQKCLDKTNELKNKFNLNKIETRLGDGLKPIEKVEIVVIAGIGGYEIIKMLSNQNITDSGEKKCNNFVLQPTKNFVDLRLWLVKENIEIVSDFVVKSGGKFYPIIVINLEKKCTMQANIFNIYFGRTNDKNNAVFYEFLLDTVERLKFVSLLEKSEIENSDNLKIKKQVFELAYELIKNYKGELKNV